MPDAKDAVGIREEIAIVLKGPDGKVKDKRKIGGKDASGKRPGT